MTHQISRAVTVGFLLSLLTAFAGPASYAAVPVDPPKIDLSRPNPKPVYPESARRHGATGTVILAVHVDEIGRPFDVQVAQSSGFIDLDRAAMEAVRHWHFQPAMQDGEAIAEWTAVGIQFDIEGVREVAAPSDTQIAEADRNRVICKSNVGSTGTRLPAGPVCLPKWQWDERERADRRQLWNAIRQPGGEFGNRH